MKQTKDTRYDTLNGLRTIACIGIVLMHVKANIGYQLSCKTPVMIISQFTNFVFLFMLFSFFD